MINRTLWLLPLFLFISNFPCPPRPLLAPLRCCVLSSSSPSTYILPLVVPVNIRVRRPPGRATYMVAWCRVEDLRRQDRSREARHGPSRTAIVTCGPVVFAPMVGYLYVSRRDPVPWEAIVIQARSDVYPRFNSLVSMLPRIVSRRSSYVSATGTEPMGAHGNAPVVSPACITTALVQVSAAAVLHPPPPPWWQHSRIAPIYIRRPFSSPRPHGRQEGGGRAYRTGGSIPFPCVEYTHARTHIWPAVGRLLPAADAHFFITMTSGTRNWLRPGNVRREPWPACPGRSHAVMR